MPSENRGLLLKKLLIISNGESRVLAKYKVMRLHTVHVLGGGSNYDKSTSQWELVIQGLMMLTVHKCS